MILPISLSDRCHLVDIKLSSVFCFMLLFIFSFMSSQLHCAHTHTHREKPVHTLHQWPASIQSLLSKTETLPDRKKKERMKEKQQGGMIQRQQRGIKGDIKKEQTEKNPAALQCWSNQLFDLAPLLFQCGPNNAVLIVLLATSELPYVGY